MIDGSHLSFEDNIRLTHEAATLAHRAGAWIEAELGAVPGDEDVSTNALPSQTMTDPLQARDFVERTGIDALAVAVGNVHGFTANPVTLDLERLNAIAAQCPVPLVLHGASGLPTEQLRGALSCGVAKVNVNAELRRAYLSAVEYSLSKAMPNADAVSVWREGRAAVSVAALGIIRSLASTCESRSTTQHLQTHSRKARP
jgi:ketose-bisphosphate aldolase